MLIAIGSALDETQYGNFLSNDVGHHDSHGGGHDGFGDSHRNHDWLNPGGYHSYSWWYPTHYNYNWYPTYTYTYYQTPVVYPTYYYEPVVYDPWWATNSYGWGSYYYTYGW